MNVNGNLKKNLEIVGFLGASFFILNVIKSGYRLPFWDVPPAYYSKNKNCFSYEGYMFSNDLKSEYHHIEIF